MEQQPGRDNEQKGFAGLNALISDVTNDIPITAEAVPGKPSAEPSPQPTASDTGQVLSQQPAQGQLQHETDFQSSGSGSFGFYLLIASAIFFLWLIHSSNEQHILCLFTGCERATLIHSSNKQHSPSYSPPSETISLQPPPPQGIATFDDLIPKASETISTQPPPPQSSATTPIAHRKSVIPDPVVRAVQQRLNELGYNAGTVDGIMGKRTRTAIESFQRDHALAVGGVASEQLLERLNNAQARTQNTQTLDQSVRNQDRYSPDWITASTETKPYQADPPVIARQCYVRPVTAPNGQPWPASASYVAGYKRLHTDGLSTVTVDNSRNDSNVFVKLFSLDGAQAYPVRVFFIPTYSSFTLNKIQAGNYDIRYCDLSTGGLSKSEPFYLKEIETYSGIQYSNITMTLYKVAHGNMQIYDISEADF